MQLFHWSGQFFRKQCAGKVNGVLRGSVKRKNSLCKRISPSMYAGCGGELHYPNVSTLNILDGEVRENFGQSQI